MNETPEHRQQAYQAAHDSVLAVRHEPPGVLIAHGPDRLDLLHRMSTNELESLAPGAWRETVFTDPVGRTIDLVTVLQEAERSVLVGLPGRAERLRDWLQKHIFFQDQVTLELPEEPWSLWGIYGPQADQLAAELGGHSPAPEQHLRLEQTALWRIDRPIAGFLVLTRSQDVELRLDRHGGGPAARQAYEVIRIEAGMPAADREIREDSIPLEIGLRQAISFTKGCYVGQEIIARMDSRGRQAKQLVRLRFQAAVEPNAALRFGERAVGSVTSVAHSPRHGWIGIGSVRSEAAQQSSLEVAGSDQRAELVEPPAATA